MTQPPLLNVLSLLLNVYGNAYCAVAKGGLRQGGKE